MSYTSIEVKRINTLLKQLVDELELWEWPLCWKRIQDDVRVRSVVPESIKTTCNDYRSRVTEIDSLLNSNDYISKYLLAYFEIVVIDTLESVYDRAITHRLLDDSMPGYSTLCIKKKDLLDRYQHSVVKNEDTSLMLLTSAATSFLDAENEIQNSIDGIKKKLSAWNRRVLLQYPISFQTLCDLASSLTSFLTILRDTLSKPINIHSPANNPNTNSPANNSNAHSPANSNTHSPANNSNAHSPANNSNTPPPKRARVEDSEDTPPSPTSNEEDEEDEEDDYPHHSARRGSRYQTPVGEFDPRVRDAYKPSREPPEQVWDPLRLDSEQLNEFVSYFPADVLEDVYVVIQRNDYDLKLAYEELEKNPPLNPISQFSPEDERRLEDNIDNMTMVHHNYFSHVRSTDVVDLFYHMDASFKDDICTICQGAGSLLFCSKCPRGFHKSCLHMNTMKEFICPFCLVNKEQLTPSEIDRIQTEYKRYIAEKNPQGNRTSSKR